MFTQKAVLLSREDPSNWESCKSITKNLRDCYLNTKTELISLTFGPETDSRSLKLLAEEIEKLKVKKLVFIDHFPCPGLLIQHLKKEYEIIVHIFGDFMLQLSSWQGVEKKSHRIKFVTASARQSMLVKKFLKEELTIEIMPFAVEESFFGPLEKKQKKDFVQFLYVGRLNSQ